MRLAYTAHSHPNSAPPPQELSLNTTATLAGREMTGHLNLKKFFLSFNFYLISGWRGQHISIEFMNVASRRLLVKTNCDRLPLAPY